MTQLENLENDEQIDSDEHVLHMWEPFNIKIEEDYNFLSNGLLFKITSTILYVIACPIVFVYNKLMYNFKIVGRENLKSIKTAKITVSNHVHQMDCTMNELINFPNPIYFPTLQSNFNIPVVRHIIKLLHAIPIPEKKRSKISFIKSIEMLLKNKKTVHFYPEASLWPYYKEIRKFKNGCFKIAVENNVPIVPIVYKFVEPYGLRKYIKRKPFIEALVLEAEYPNNNNIDKNEAVNELKERVYLKMKM